MILFDLITYIYGLTSPNVSMVDYLHYAAMVWQMMRSYTVGLLQSLSKDKSKPIKDADIINWANNKVG